MALWVAKKEVNPPVSSRRRNPVQNSTPLVELRAGYSREMRLFMRAAKNGSVEDVKKLLESEKVNPNGQGKYGDTALMIAAANGYLRTASALLENGADPNARGRHFITPLMVAVKWSMSPEMIEMLIEHGAKVRARNILFETALDEANWSLWLRAYPETRKLLEQKWVEEGFPYKFGRFLSEKFSGKNAEA